jgi:hypothetical protein
LSDDVDARSVQRRRVSIFIHQIIQMKAFCAIDGIPVIQLSAGTIDGCQATLTQRVAIRQGEPSQTRNAWRAWAKP